MIRIAVPLVSVLFAPLSSAQEVPPSKAVRHDIAVAFVGDADTPRSRAFADFLGERFEHVAVFDRSACDPAELAQSDVVLLDWDQQSGVNRWGQWADPREEPSSPLGPREQWRTPTVLVGSAGLSLASAWSVRGSSG